MSDEQVSELRYIEELEAEVEKLQRSTVHALYQGQKKRAEAAEAKLAEVQAEADAVIDSWRTQCIDLQAEVEKLRGQAKEDETLVFKALARAGNAEAKLAEVEEQCNVAIRARNAAWEDTAEACNQRDIAKNRLAEVEKERNEWKEDAILTHSEYIDLPSRASIERARELVEELITPPVTRSPWPAGAQEDLQTIARLLSGKAE